MKNARTRLAALIVLTYFLFTGCKKEGSSTDLTPQKEEEIATLSAVSETESQTIFDDVFDNVLGVNTEVGVGSIGVFGRLSPRTGLRETGVDSIAPCVAVSITRLNAPDLFPARVVLDFGNGCLGKDGHWRYGKMITEYTGRLIVGGKSATTSFNGFKLDSTSVEGSYKITNTASAAGERQFTIDITAANLSKPSGNFIQWSSHKVISQTAGMATPDQPLDDVYDITGYGHGRMQRNDDLYAWQSQITEALQKRLSCRWITKGTIQVRRETLPSSSPFTASFNFGSGSCDFLAQLTLNGLVKDVQLPH